MSFLSRFEIEPIFYHLANRARIPSMTALDMLKHEESLVWTTTFHCS